MATEKTDPVFFDETFENYWYDDQLYNYIVQFMKVFEGMVVRIGKNSLGSNSQFIPVPIRYAGVDRVVESIISQNTTNSPLRPPLFAVKLVDMQMAPDRRKGVNTTDRYVFTPTGHSLPDGAKVVYRKTPVPYDLSFELNILTSNDLQKFQILEQIFTIFDPTIQIQTSDAPFDGTKLTTVELMGINFEENYPSGTDKKLNVTSLIFKVPAWMYAPLDFKNNYIKSIQLRLNATSGGIDVGSVIDDEEAFPQDDTGEIEIADVDKMADFPKK